MPARILAATVSFDGRRWYCAFAVEAGKVSDTFQKGVGVTVRYQREEGKLVAREVIARSQEGGGDLSGLANALVSSGYPDGSGYASTIYEFRCVLRSPACCR